MLNYKRGGESMNFGSFLAHAQKYLLILFKFGKRARTIESRRTQMNVTQLQFQKGAKFQTGAKI